MKEKSTISRKISSDTVVEGMKAERKEKKQETRKKGWVGY
jgi:hypothetical protein